MKPLAERLVVDLEAQPQFGLGAEGDIPGLAGWFDRHNHRGPYHCGQVCSWRNSAEHRRRGARRQYERGKDMKDQ